MNTQMQQMRRVSTGPARRQATTVALFGKRAGAAVAEKPSTKSSKATKKETPVKESIVSQTLNAFDFAAPRSQRDAELLYQAKYGQQADEETGKYKMTREQYGALRRKVGGTAKEFFKTNIQADVTGAYMKPTEPSSQVPFLPLLLGVTAALLITTVVVVVQTS